MAKASTWNWYVVFFQNGESQWSSLFIGNFSSEFFTLVFVDPGLGLPPSLGLQIYFVWNGKLSKCCKLYVQWERWREMRIQVQGIKPAIFQKAERWLHRAVLFWHTSIISITILPCKFSTEKKTTLRSFWRRIRSWHHWMCRALIGEIMGTLWGRILPGCYGLLPLQPWTCWGDF